MPSSLRIVVLVLAVLVAGPALADAELLLTDGSVLRGVEVKLEAGFYLLELEDGDVVAIPASLVRELHLLDSRKTKEGVTIGVATDASRPASQQDPPSRLVERRPNWRRGAAQDLVGAPMRFDDTARQMKVFGEPARFQTSPVPFRFEPTHAWDRDIDVLGANRSTWQLSYFDPVWRPRAAFDMTVDVLEASRSTWSTGSRAMDWNPSNSFSRLRADRWWGREPEAEPDVRFDWRGLTRSCGWCAGVTPKLDRFTEPEVDLTSEACARRLFADAEEPETLQWIEVESLPASLSMAALHRAWTDAGTRGVFSIAGGSCRLIAGDLRELLGVKLTETDALVYAVAAWNEIVADFPVDPGTTPAEQIDLAFSLVTLFETATSGSREARLELIQDRAAAERLLATDTRCSQSGGFREAQRAHVERNFERASAAVDVDTTNVSFWTWLDRDGEVFEYHAQFSRDGLLTLSRDAIAEHLGNHEDQR